MARTERIQTATNSAGAAPRQSGSGSARIVVHAATGAAIGPSRSRCLDLLQWLGRRVEFDVRAAGLLLRAHRDDRIDIRGPQRGNPARHESDPGHGQRRHDQRDGIVRRYPEQHPANDPAGEQGARDA